MNMLLALILTIQAGELKYIDPPKKPYAYIEMDSRVDCMPCLRWKYSEKKKLEDAGWVVVEKTTIKQAPVFRVVIGERRITHIGYLTMEKLREIVNAKGK